MKGKRVMIFGLIFLLFGRSVNASTSVNTQSPMLLLENNQSEPSVNVRNSTIPGQWIKSGTRWWYRHNDGGYTQNAWEYITGNWYLFDASGWMLTGWQKHSNYWYYLGGTDDGAMRYDWQLINGKWYYFGAFNDGAMKSGWMLISGKWYYFGGADDGVMKTGWQKIVFPGLYNNGAYWNYFNSSGVFITDSDTKGCTHGINTFLDHKSGTSYMKYVVSSSAHAYASSSEKAVSYWNNMSGIKAFFSKGTNQLQSHINVTASTSFDTNTLARTYYFIDGNTTRPAISNWIGCQIDINSGRNDITTATITHEFGHTLGLTHRISMKSSIMCQLGQGRTATVPVQDDVSVVNHLY